MHNELASKGAFSTFTVDCFYVCHPFAVAVLRFGELAAARNGIERYLELFGKPGALEFDEAGVAVNLASYPTYHQGIHIMEPAVLLAGFDAQYLRFAAAWGAASFSAIDDKVATWMAPLLKFLGWAVTEPINTCHYSAGVLEESMKIVLHYCDPDAVTAAEAAGLLSAPPGTLCTGRRSGYDYDIADGASWWAAGGQSMEPELRERVGQRAPAVAACEAIAARFPHNHVRRAMSAMVTMRCQAAASEPDAGQATFRASADDVHTHTIFLFEMLLARDFVAHVCGPDDPAARGAALQVLGRTVHAMSGDRGELTALLGTETELDAAAAAAEFADG